MTVTSKASTTTEGRSALYNTMHETCIEFLASMDRDSNSPSGINVPRLLAARTPDFEQSWGHNFFTALHPAEYGTPMTIDGLITHMEAAAPMLASWDATVTDIIIDETQKKGVMRSSYWMQAASKAGEAAKEVVENDMVWLLDFDSTGKKVKKAVEFKDPIADGRFIKTMTE